MHVKVSSGDISREMTTEENINSFLSVFDMLRFQIKRFFALNIQHFTFHIGLLCNHPVKHFRRCHSMLQKTKNAKRKTKPEWCGRARNLWKLIILWYLFFVIIMFRWIMWFFRLLFCMPRHTIESFILATNNTKQSRSKKTHTLNLEVKPLQIMQSNSM